MPLAIILGMLTVAVIYLATNISYFVVLTVDQIRNSEAVASVSTFGNGRSVFRFKHLTLNRSSIIDTKPYCFTSVAVKTSNFFLEY